MSEEGDDTPDSIAAMFLNPSAVNQRHKRYEDHPGVSKASVQIHDTSEEADRFIRHERRREREETSNSPAESEEEGEEFEDDEQPSGSARPRPLLDNVNSNQVMSLADQQSAEKTDLLVRLNKYINCEVPQLTLLIPQQPYNLSTPLSVLREIVNLLDRVNLERQRARKRDTGRKMVYSGINFLANILETCNTRLLEPESQFALDKFSEFTEKEIGLGTYEESADGMWEKLEPYLGGLTNPFAQFALAFGGGMVKYVMERERAYKLGALPDPRPERRKRLDEEMREEQMALENNEMDESSGVPPTNPFAAPGSYLPAPTLSDNVPRSKIATAAAAPPPTSFSFPMGFESSDDEAENSIALPAPNSLANNLGGEPIVPIQFAF